MGSDRLLRFVFVLYCTSVGGVLVTLPWSMSWNIMITHLPRVVSSWLEEPMIRGLLSGFGLVHLVWALHDVAALGRPPVTAQPIPAQPTTSAARPSAARPITTSPSRAHEALPSENPGDH